jgi:hypothetical protein
MLLMFVLSSCDSQQIGVESEAHVISDLFRVKVIDQPSIQYQSAVEPSRCHLRFRTRMMNLPSRVQRVLTTRSCWP